MLSLNDVFFGAPLYAWALFLTLVFTLLAFDLGVLSRDKKPISIKKSFLLSLFYISIGLLFAVFINWQMGSTKAMEYVTGFVVEKTLAIDNVFVIAMIFSYFAIPNHLQHRVLLLGVLGVLILRGIMIFLGAAIVEEYEWVLLIFAAFLIFTGVKMLFDKGGHDDLSDNKLLKWLQKALPVADKLHGDKFFVKENIGGKVKTLITPLFLALIMVELADLIFAVDSIPAIFAITTDPFIVFTSNIFAILGLRALYFALAAMIDRFEYLKYSLGVLLIFIGGKVYAADLLGMEKFPASIALGVSALIIALGILPSFLINKQSK